MAERDTTLLHQVVLSTAGFGIAVSCNCRVTIGEHEKAGKLIYDHIGYSHNWQETCQLFNNPDNHWAPFGDEYKIGKRSRFL